MRAGISTLAAALEVALLSLSVAICAAAPEFIWRGGRIVLGHFGRTELGAALLIGLVLAFFVEPLMERARARLHGHRHGFGHGTEHATGHASGQATRAGPRGRSPLFSACVGIAFAIASVVVHDAIVAFVAARADAEAADAGLRAAIELTVAWAIVPFTVTLAWLTTGDWPGTGRRWAALPAAILAASSGLIAGWLFAWSWQDVVTAVVPCLFIVALGYRAFSRHPSPANRLAACAPVLALCALVWLPVAGLGSAALAAAHLERLQPYTPESFAVDVRFYLGWWLGLALAPRRHAGRARGAAPGAG